MNTENQGRVVSEEVIDTPEGTKADYVYTDHYGNRVYYDGFEYWVVENGKIYYYG